MIKEQSPKSHGPVLGLTFKDFEDNFKKSKRKDHTMFENIEEYLTRNKDNQSSEGLVSISINKCSNLVEVDESLPADVEDFIEFASVSHGSKHTCLRFIDVPKEKISHCSSLRFGLGPLEMIQESKDEDRLHYFESTSIFSHNSQQVSPRANLLVSQSRKHRKIMISSPLKPSNPRRLTKRKVLASPYEQVLFFSPQRLPLLKSPRKPNQILRSLTTSKPK